MRTGHLLDAGYLYIGMTVLFTVYGQLIFRWQIGQAGAFPADWPGRVAFMIRQVANPWILSAFFAAFLAPLSWIAALTRFDLGFAYPFTSLAFALMMILPIVIFHEQFSWART